jgi:hypothetical protein
MCIELGYCRFGQLAAGFGFHLRDGGLSILLELWFRASEVDRAD